MKLFLFSIISLLSTTVWAGANEKIAQDQFTKILEMIGPHGVFAIVGTIIMVRFIRVLWYLDRKDAFITTLVTAAIFGTGSSYFAIDDATVKQILGGGFFAMVAAIPTFIAIKMALTWSYQKTGAEILRVMFFFISPRPLKIKKAGGKKGETIKVPPNPTLTQLMDDRFRKK